MVQLVGGRHLAVAVCVHGWGVWGQRELHRPIALPDARPAGRSRRARPTSSRRYRSRCTRAASTPAHVYPASPGSGSSRSSPRTALVPGQPLQSACWSCENCPHFKEPSLDQSPACAPRLVDLPSACAGPARRRGGRRAARPAGTTPSTPARCPWPTARRPARPGPSRSRAPSPASPAPPDSTAGRVTPRARTALRGPASPTPTCKACVADRGGLQENARVCAPMDSDARLLLHPLPPAPGQRGMERRERPQLRVLLPGMLLRGRYPGLRPLHPVQRMHVRAGPLRVAVRGLRRVLKRRQSSQLRAVGHRVRLGVRGGLHARADSPARGRGPPVGVRDGGGVDALYTLPKSPRVATRSNLWYK